MINFQLHRAGSVTTARLLRFTIAALPHPEGPAVTDGLPAGSMRLAGAGLIVGGTPVMVPLFRPAMERAALAMRSDVLIARHGAHPEALDPVLWDVAIWSGDHVVPINDLVLYADPDGIYWLVPTRQGPHIRLAPDGLHLDAESPFITWHQRCDGVCEAAKRLLIATGGGRHAR
jgi:hypothetical protein